MEKPCIKGVFILLVALLLTGQLPAQCHCGSSQLSSIVETGSPTLTLPSGIWAAEFMSEFRQFSPHETDGHAHTHTGDNPEVTSLSSNTLALRYGVARWVMLSLQMPWLGLMGEPRGAGGFGDLQLVGMGEVLRIGQFGAGLQAGLELPTGRRMPGLPESGLMIGSGSWDFLGGVVLAQGIGQKSFMRASALYKRGTIGLADLDFGEFFSVGAVASRSLWGNQAQCMTDSTAVPKALNAYVGLLAERSDPQRQLGVLVPNTGGDILFAQAGLLLSVRKWSIPVAFLFPLYQDPLGEQNHAFCRARLGLIRTF